MTAKKSDLEEKVTGLPSEDVIAETEYSLIDGLLNAAAYKDDDSMQKEVRIERNGKFLFKFNVRPLSEEEVFKCRKAATSYMPNPANKKLPKIEKDIDMSLLRSWKVYMATVDEDKKQIWDNPQLKQNFPDVVQGVEMVDILLAGGEKSAVEDLIDKISGYDIDLTEYAKN